MLSEHVLAEETRGWKQVFLGYSTDETVRGGAASGGFVSAFLIHLLESGQIDAAYVSRTVVEDGKLRGVAKLAETKEDILAARTSIYMDFPFFNNLEAIKDPKYRKVAVVGLPCHLKQLSERAEREPWLKDKLLVTIALFCTCSSTRALIDHVLEREGVDMAQVDQLQFKSGHWRGNLTLRMKDASVVRLPYLKHFGLYMHLFLFACPRCLSCSDHFGRHADIDCGDAFLPELKKHPVKHSIAILRTPGAVPLFQGLLDSGGFTATPLPPERVVKSQKRGVIRKLYGPAAFKRLAPLFGFKVADGGGARPRWNHYLLASLLLLNMRAGRNKTLAKLAFRLPRAVLFPYVLLIKLLNNF